MTGIKNWLVRCEALQDESALMKTSLYIDSKANPKHENTEITGILNNPKKFIRNSLNAFNNKRNSQLAEKKKGRVVAKTGSSWIFSLPPGYEPTKQQWKEISKDIFEEFSKYLTPNITREIFKEHSIIRLHEEEGKNPHLHMLISNVMLNEVQRDLTRKPALNSLKTAFRKSVLKNAGFSNKDYTPLDNPTPKKQVDKKEKIDPIEEYLNLSKEEQSKIVNTLEDYRNRGEEPKIKRTKKVRL